ncbi:hypothetical protein B0H94_1162 [Salsuginibacillus halophilus]|uniref:DUF4190 domain-containing protein n=1 Tax=Salsuginibacillus halophilus TaxID=517424 RepID=A0A2P8H7U9_9BACI|nr:hypothetical protein [Salsuginibacillus halophilus]PSL42303.1 hypothetical protein B0H94_1162 [Salsuginibacillus halophilus]
MAERYNEYGGEDVREPDYSEETASEAAATGLGDRRNIEEPERPEEEQRSTMESNVDDDSVGKGLGVTALILAICSLFFLPILLGAGAVILGFFAAAKGAQSLGYWGVGLGAFSIIISLFFQPFF